MSVRIPGSKVTLADWTIQVHLKFYRVEREIPVIIPETTKLYFSFRLGLPLLCTPSGRQTGIFPGFPPDKTVILLVQIPDTFSVIPVQL